MNLKSIMDPEGTAKIRELLATKEYWLFIAQVPIEQTQFLALMTVVHLLVDGRELVFELPKADVCFVIRSDTSQNERVSFPDLMFTFVPKSLLARDKLDEVLRICSFAKLKDEQDLGLLFDGKDAQLPDNVLRLLKTFCMDDLSIQRAERGGIN